MAHARAAWQYRVQHQVPGLQGAAVQNDVGISCFKYWELEILVLPVHT